MKLNHLNLPVTNMEGARDLLTRYFGLKEINGAPPTGKLIGLHDGEGFTLTLMPLKDAGHFAYPPPFHIGFLNKDKEKINALYEQLKHDGYELHPPGFYHDGDLYFTTSFGFMIQVS
jgi:catechol 2,3-dioxygenase-like lactoylglutathione lyase family enzyme